MDRNRFSFSEICFPTLWQKDIMAKYLRTYISNISMTSFTSVKLLLNLIWRSYPKASYVGIYKFLNEKAILIRDVDLIKDVMARSFNHFHNNDLSVDYEMDYLISQNPFFSKDDKWKTNRSVMAPLFTPMKIKILFPIINNVCQSLISYIQKFGNKKFEAKKVYTYISK